MEAHLKLRPLDFPTEGIFLCGLAHYPKFISETISQANGAAARAATILLRDTVVSSGAIGEVLEEECIGCGLCQKVCPYGAIELQETPEGKKAWIIPPICKGCGACSSRCPAQAISQHHFTDAQIFSQIHAAYSVPVKKSEPKIIAFLCNWCGYAAADLAGVSKYQFPSNIRVIRVMCSARVSSKFIMEAFSREIDGILVVGCRSEDCHYISGIYETMKIIPSAKRTLEKVGINPERLRLEHTSAAEATKFVDVVNSFTSMITQLGSLQLSEEQKEGLWEATRKKEKKKGKAEVGDSFDN
jgi:heterodisulfide reductase subunit A